MRLRPFVLFGGTVLAWAATALAQGTTPVVGWVHSGASAERAKHVEAFRQGLKEGGYIEGRDVKIEYRWANGRQDRLPELVADLVNRKVSVIAAPTTPAAVAAKTGTSTIPIVFMGGFDPVKLGLVANLRRPGGNATGVANIAGELEGKRIETLRDLVPSAKRIAYLANPRTPGATAWIKDAEAAGKMTAVEVHAFTASTEAEIDSAFGTIAQSRLNAVVVSNDAFFLTRREQIVALAARYSLPASYPFREYVVAGGLMSLGPDLIDAYRQQGVYTARVLRGAKPADLPVFQADKFELVVNRKVAQQLGLVVSRDFLERINEIIE